MAQSVNSWKPKQGKDGWDTACMSISFDTKEEAKEFFGEKNGSISFKNDKGEWETHGI